MTGNNLISRLQEDMKLALKSGNRDRLAVIRMLLSEAKNADLRKPPATPLKMVEAHGKRLRKAREEYQRLGRAEEVSKLDHEIAVVEEYLPKQASADETQRLVESFLAAHPDLKPADLGRAMGMFMKEHGASVDPATANSLLRQKLAVR